MFIARVYALCFPRYIFYASFVLHFHQIFCPTIGAQIVDKFVAIFFVRGFVVYFDVVSTKLKLDIGLVQDRVFNDAVYHLHGK